MNPVQMIVTSGIFPALSWLCPAGFPGGKNNNKSEIEGEKGEEGGRNTEGRKASPGQFISV